MTTIGSKVGDLITALNARGLRVDKIFLSGGGGEAGDCRRMALEWIYSRVSNLVAGQPETPFTPDIWEELRP